MSPRAAQTTAGQRPALSDDAKAVLSAHFSMGRKTVLTFQLVKCRPTTRMQAALDELVAAGVLRRQSVYGVGISYLPERDTTEFRGWLTKNTGAGKFEMVEKVAA